MSIHQCDAHPPELKTQVEPPRTSRWVVCLGFAVVAVVSGITHARAIRKVKCHVDERDWTTRAYFYRLAFMDRNFDHWLWRAHDGIDHPHVTDFLIGASFQLFGQSIPEVPAKTQSWFEVDLPQGDRLFIARLPCAILGSMVAPLVCLIGVLISGRLLVGLTSGLLYAIHPLAVMCQVRAMSDGPLMFFSAFGMCTLLAAFPGSKAVDSSHAFTKRGLGFLAVGTLAHALAVGTKLTGIFVVLAMACSVTIMAIWQIGTPRPRSSTSNLAWMAWAIAAVLLTAIWSVVVNPTLYRQPVSQFQIMLNHRTRVADGQKKAFKRDAMNDTSVKFVKLISRLNWDYSPVHSQAFSIAQLCLFVIGLLDLLFREVSRLWGRLRPSRAASLLVWTWILVCILTPALPLDWPRYYLPYLPCWVLFVGCGTGLVTNWLVCPVKSKGALRDIANQTT